MTEFQEQVITSLATLTTKVEALQEDVAQVRSYQRDQNGRVFSLSDEVVEIKTQLAVSAGRSRAFSTLMEWVRPGIYVLIVFLVLMALEHPDVLKTALGQ
jgi:DNA phosphorothioation-dependent restriction protein DptG